MKLALFLPLLLFITIAAILALNLDEPNREIPSALIGQKAPNQVNPTLLSQQAFSSQQMLGKPWLLNVWASWCLSCQQEHKYLLQLASKIDTHIIGLNYKDKPEHAQTWLNKRGNPYSRIIKDTAGEQGIDWGIYAVPETFLIDAEGIIRYKHIGPLDETTLESIILPFLQGHINS